MTKDSTLKFFINTYINEIEASALNIIKNEEPVNYEMVEVPNQCLQNVLGFARAYRVIETVQTGKSELMLN